MSGPGRVALQASIPRLSRVLLMLACLFHGGHASAHLFLTAETLDDALARIAQAHAAISDGPDSGAEPVYRLGRAASELADLMNEEVRVHGLGQESLMTEGIERAQAFGVTIRWSDDHGRFFYDGSAFDRYLELAADGAHAADSRYRLIELDFYLGRADSIVALEEKAEDKRQFLEAHPDFPARARVGIFLGIDYRDLYRLCLGREDPDCATRYGRLAVEQFGKIASAHAGSDSAELAERLLRRTENEIKTRAR